MACEYCRIDREFAKHYEWRHCSYFGGTDLIQIDCNVGGEMYVYTENRGNLMKAGFNINYCPNCGQRIIGQHDDLPKLNIEISGLLAWIDSVGMLVTGEKCPTTIERIPYVELVSKIKKLKVTEWDVLRTAKNLVGVSLILREIISEKYPQYTIESESPADVFRVAEKIAREESE